MTMSCQSLWEVRNTVFKQNGYCFRTSDAIRAFGNAGCQYDDERAVPLNTYERENVATIRQAEQRKGCRAGGR
ncbi:MAG: YARHG domain-containing protein [Beijerinckiaceae bacterium]